MTFRHSFCQRVLQPKNRPVDTPGESWIYLQNNFQTQTCGTGLRRVLSSKNQGAVCVCDKIMKQILEKQTQLII